MRKLLSALGVAFAIAAPSLSMAATVTGYMRYTFTQAYAVESTNLQHPDSTPYSDLPVTLICVDHSTQAPFDQTTTFLTEAGGTALKGGSGNAGVAAVHWLLDNYYLTYFKNGTGPQQRAIQYALWEIGNDYNGTVGSINDNAGASRPASGNDVVYPPTHADYPAFVTAYQTLYQAMTTAFATLPSTYRATTLTVDLFNNQDPAKQSMAAIIERAPPNVVPTAVPTITGTTQVGSTVTGTYTYADSNSDIENPSGTLYRFVTSTNSTITGSGDGTVVATGSTGGAASSVNYTLQAADLNRYVYYCVTPAAQTGASPGLEACTLASGPVTNAPPPNVVPTAVPTITGTTQVGSTVTGTYTYADSNSDIENPSGTIYHFVTSTSSTITGSGGGTVVATGSTGGAAGSVPYTLQPADLNKYVYYCVTPAAQTGASPGLEVCTLASGPVTSAAVPQTLTPTPVPSLGQWALMALMSLLALFGMSRVRQRNI
ncbi:IPTL-CTERM sorting domain-containing protein [Ottowia thiooxydans]|uniref:IPTL-CTERM sorting domain-containing protein n=1 Tax=Ottowia thiooxydans TaxID=219182 RepID=UPI0004248B0D|nr:IPTL-CTERM sorting domain-containing protein [Ottowia thiooxydans]